MDHIARRAACDRAYRLFPELRGVQPSAAGTGGTRVFTFRRDIPVAPGGPVLRQVVRVTVSTDGRVLKVAASR
jgi:hypothetical protein